jgi:uncharacterized delta-60 repeat protein
LLAAIVVGALLVALSSLAPLSLAAAGSKEAFGTDGLAFHSFPPHAGARATIIDLAAVGKSRMVGALGNEMTNSRRTYFGAARFDADGSLDRSFAQGGFARVVRPRLGGAVGMVHGQAEAVAVDDQGRILLAGFRFRNSTSQIRYPVLVRLLPDGALDPSFGRDGVVTPARVSGYGEWFSDLAVEAGGRIVAVGGRTQLHEQDGYHGPKPATLVRAFLSDGRIDRNFADGGSFSTSVSSDSYFRDFTAFRTIRVVRGGKLLLSGYRSYRLLLERLTPNGHLDRSFGHGGSVQVGFEGSECHYLCEYDSALMLTGDHRILVQGVLNPLGSEREALVCFLPNGSIDRSFGNRGIAYDRFGENLVDIGAIVPAPHDHFLVVGSGHGRSSLRSSLLALRFASDGSLDPAFGDHGILSLGPPKGNSGGEAALVRPDGSVVAAGGAWLPGKPPRHDSGSQILMLARLR